MSFTSLFPAKLHEILSAVEKDGQESIVSWLPDGRAFRVHQRGPFVELIMKQHFKQTKFKSFQRQLNLWGFQQMKEGPDTDKGGYFHPLFVRDDPLLCKAMKRKTVDEKMRIVTTKNNPVPFGIMSGIVNNTSMPYANRIRANSLPALAIGSQISLQRIPLYRSSACTYLDSQIALLAATRATDAILRTHAANLLRQDLLQSIAPHVLQERRYISNHTSSFIDRYLRR